MLQFTLLKERNVLVASYDMSQDASRVRIEMSNQFWHHLLRSDRPRLMGHSHPLTRPVGPIPFNEWCVNFPKAQNYCLLIHAITTWHFPVFWPHSHAIVNHFSIGHLSFHYSSSNTINSEVLNGCVPEKISALWWCW